MELFKNKYRTQTTRAQWWDYSMDGSYYITICTHNREWFFGTILNGKMVLSEIGEIITQEWQKSFEIRGELYCDSFVIMPNHIHAIIWLNKNGLFNHPPITKIGTPHVPIPNPDDSNSPNSNTVEAVRLYVLIWEIGIKSRKRVYPKIPALHTARPNPFHHLWPVLNLRQPNK